MPLSAIEYLRHILDETNFLVEEIRGLNETEFMTDSARKRAFTRSLEIIGEATKRVPPDVRDVGRKLTGGQWPGCATG